MRIDETKMFEFRFPFYGGEFSIPIRAQARDEAADLLRSILQQWLIEIVTEFPRPAPSSSTAQDDARGSSPRPNTGEPPPAAVPTYALELDIEALVKDIVPIKKPKGAQTVDRLVKEWTGFEYAPQNYAAIIDELRKLKNG